MSINRQLCLKTRPEGLVQRGNFDLVEEVAPELKDGDYCGACCTC
jgi:Putative NADP-dependent oxidoreductases